MLIGDIPNLYPYIVDDVGEAIQAKRRGRGVMLSHLTPMLRQSGLYAEYGRMAGLVGEYEQATARNSATAPEKMQFLYKAVQLAIVQTDIDNLIADNSRRIKTKLLAEGLTEKEAEEQSRLRIFSEESGSYGNGVSEMAGASGIWKDQREVVDVFEKRSGFAFGGGHWGKEARALLREQLSSVDVAVHSRSSNVYGLLDNDDMFQYLGGLAMAVRHEAGRAPETLITSQQKAGQVKVEDMAATLGRELRSRYLNPKWIEGMQQEEYAGAREMSNFVEYLWGWQVTTPDKVDATMSWRKELPVATTPVIIHCSTRWWSPLSPCLGL